jgi:hypothetical protein
MSHTSGMHMQAQTSAAALTRSDLRVLLDKQLGEHAVLAMNATNLGVKGSPAFAAADAWACECMPAIGVLVLVRVAANAATVTTTASAATPKSETKSLERMGQDLPSGTISGADSPRLPIRFGLGFVQERGEPACAGPQGVA